MYVAFDDTDSPHGMCTTYLATEIIKRTDLQLIGYPRIVRLNPNIGYKTRGNGAIALNLGKGKGEPRKIGMIDERPVYSYPGMEEAGSPDEIMNLASEVVSDFAQLKEENTNPGIVVVSSPLNSPLYKTALSNEVSKEEVRVILGKANAQYKEIKNGRGIIGASAALAWPRKRVTYELLAYEYPKPSSISADLKLKAASEIEAHYPHTFNNIDSRNRDAAIFPSNRTPVLYGIRSVYSDHLYVAEQDLSEKFGIRGSRSLIFETNQGTDDHIIRNSAALWDGGSFCIEGEISETPQANIGGHYFTKLNWHGSSITLAAFEPTKEFRKVFRQLRKGDRISVYGSFAEGTLKVEKMDVITVARHFRKTPPMCKECGIVMKNHGKNDFRCPKCTTRGKVPAYTEEVRSLKPGRFEVPVCARRHLSMPVKLEPYFSDFLAPNIPGGFK